MTGACAAAGATGILSFAGLVSTVVDDSSPTTFALKTDGTIEENGLFSARWIVNGAPTNYEVQASLSGGTVTGAATGSWLDFTANRTWTRSTGVPILAIDIRDKNTTTVMRSVSIQLGT